jgi:hypothetical protein
MMTYYLFRQSYIWREGSGGGAIPVRVQVFFSFPVKIIVFRYGAGIVSSLHP